MTDVMTWLRQRTAAAPPALRERMLQHVASAGSVEEAATALAGAGACALSDVTEAPGDRSVALDLLAADGLITLAMLWCAEHDPAALGKLARSLTEPAQAT